MKIGMGSRERWRGDVGDVTAARARRGSGRDDTGVVGVKEV